MLFFRPQPLVSLLSYGLNSLDAQNTSKILWQTLWGSNSLLPFSIEENAHWPGPGQTGRWRYKRQPAVRASYRPPVVRTRGSLWSASVLGNPTCRTARGCRCCGPRPETLGTTAATTRTSRPPSLAPPPSKFTSSSAVSRNFSLHLKESHFVHCYVLLF